MEYSSPHCNYYSAIWVGLSIIVIEKKSTYLSGISFSGLYFFQGFDYVSEWSTGDAQGLKLKQYFPI
jgi:hypothetical protein